MHSYTYTIKKFCSFSSKALYYNGLDSDEQTTRHPDEQDASSSYREPQKQTRRDLQPHS